MRSLFRQLKKPSTVLTPTGLKSFTGVLKSFKPALKIETGKNTIEVAEKHIFVINDIERFAKDLKIGDKLQTENGYTYITNITSIGKKDVYDLTNVDSEVYYTNGILSHNTFMGSSYTLISTEKLSVLEPLPVQETVGAKLKIYKYFEKGRQYVCSVDPAKDGIDGFVVNFIDITDFKFEQVATANLDIDYLLMPKYLNEWCQMYNNPYLIIENNEGAGQSVADQMKITYEYENLHYDSKVDAATQNRVKARKKYPGTRTTSKTRNQILKTMKTFFDNGNLIINDVDTINQLYTFILLNEKYQADVGNHDDCVMSLALCFILFNNVKNFNDMSKIAEVIESTKAVDVQDVMVIGSFDHEPEELTYNTEITYEGFDDDDAPLDITNYEIAEFG